LSLHTLFAKPTLGELSAEVDSLRQQEQADLGEPLVPVSRTESLALSYAQERLWSMALRLRGQLNVAALEASLQAIVSRHESLRTLFVATDGNPIQVIQERTLTLSRIDLSALEGETQVAEVRRLQRDEAAKPFDLSQDLMLRATLLDLGEVNESVVNEQVPIPTDQLVANNEPSSCHPVILSSCHVLLLTMHHIASDGWSMGIFRRELSALPTLDLPLDFPRPAQQTFDGARTTLQLSPEVSQQLIVLSQQKGSTLFMTLLAAFNLLLARLSGQEDILVGTPIAGRNQLETENLIGFFISTLVLRTDISGNPTFEELLSRVKQTTLDAYSHQDIPFEKLIQALQPKRDLSRSPLFQVWFNMLTERQMTHSPDLLITEPLERENDVTAKFDLTLYVRDTQSGIRFNAVYNTHLFTQARIENMLSLFEQILKKIVEDASAPIAALVPFVTVPHIGPRSSFEPVPVSATDCSIAARFEAKAAQYPNHIAIETAIHQWSYAELNARANQIAHALRAKNATPGRIGLLFEHDAPMIAAILGVLKAGKLYVPLDPTYPQS